MACYNPLKARQSGENPAKFIHGEMKIEQAKSMYTDFILLPCGKCKACKLTHSKMWANRCYLESLEWKNNYFLTLTYRNKDLPQTRRKINKATGEVAKIPMLKKSDLQKFIKRLRWHKKEQTKYYACGEYGAKYGRPHYHAIIFNLKLNDLQINQISREGNVYYTSKELDKIWGKGNVMISEANWRNSAYVSRYILKKEKNEWYDRNKIAPQFSVMSTRPAIGIDYYNRHKETIKITGLIDIFNGNNFAQEKIPRFYEKLIKRENPRDLERLKIKNKQAGANDIKRKLQAYNLETQEELNEMLKRRLERSTQQLVRNLDNGIGRN